MVISIAFAIANILHQLRWRVEDVGRRHQRPCFGSRFPRGFLRLVCRVRFWCGREIKARLNDCEFAFGAPEKIIGVLCGKALNQRLRIGQPNILARKTDKAAQHIKRLLPCNQHPRQPVKCCLRIAAPQRFVER